MDPTVINHTSTTAYDMTPPEVAYVMKLRQRIVLPILLTLVLITNICCGLVTLRPKVKNVHINRYIQCMIVVDILMVMAYIPQVFFAETCTFKDYMVAYFKAHFRSSTIYYTKFLTIYILVSVSCDRFIAVWLTMSYKRLTAQVGRTLAILGIYITISAIPNIFLGEVTGREEQWRGVSAFRNTQNKWARIYKMYIIASMCVIPLMVLVFCSVGLLVGIVTKIPKNKSRNLQSISAILIINSLYMLGTMSYGVVHLTTSLKDGVCYLDAEREIVLLLLEALIMAWSIVNIIIFFAMSKD